METEIEKLLCRRLNSSQSKLLTWTMIARWMSSIVSVIAAGMERVCAEITELQRKGLLNGLFPSGNFLPPKRI